MQGTKKTKVQTYLYPHFSLLFLFHVICIIVRIAYFYFTSYVGLIKLGCVKWIRLDKIKLVQITLEKNIRYCRVVIVIVPYILGASTLRLWGFHLTLTSKHKTNNEPNTDSNLPGTRFKPITASRTTIKCTTTWQC